MVILSIFVGIFLVFFPSFQCVSYHPHYVPHRHDSYLATITHQPRFQVPVQFGFIPIHMQFHHSISMSHTRLLIHVRHIIYGFPHWVLYMVIILIFLINLGLKQEFRGRMYRYILVHHVGGLIPYVQPIY